MEHLMLPVTMMSVLIVFCSTSSIPLQPGTAGTKSLAYIISSL